MKAKSLILVAILAAAVGYAGFLLARQISLLKKTCIKMVSYQLNGILTRNASLVIKLQVSNNSDIDLQAKNGKFDIYLNDTFISTVPIAITQTLRAHSTISLPITAYFNPATVIKEGFQSLIQDPNNIAISIKGKISVLSSVIAINNLKIDKTIMLSEILTSNNSNQTC